MEKINKSIIFELSSEDRKILMKCEEIISKIRQEMGSDDIISITESQYKIYNHKFTFSDLCNIGQFLIQLKLCEKIEIKGEEK